MRSDVDLVPKLVELVHEGLTFKVPICVEMPTRVVADEQSKVPTKTLQSDDEIDGLQDESL